MTIKLDENLPHQLVQLLTDLGHDVDTVPNEHIAGQDDDVVWAAAQSAGRFLVTQDLDFSDARKYVPGTHHGVLLVRLPQPGRSALVERISTLFRTEAVEAWTGASSRRHRGRSASSEPGDRCPSSPHRALFRGRTDVYPRRFESRKTGKSGYAPACANEWVRGICEKPRIKCAVCPHRRFLPVTDDVIRWHLSGRDDTGQSFVAGVYPLLLDEKCFFLAIDFDKTGWQADAVAALRACERVGIAAALERSRSGGGGHVWLFFEEAISAARRALRRECEAPDRVRRLRHFGSRSVMRRRWSRHRVGWHAAPRRSGRFRRDRCRRTDTSCCDFSPKMWARIWTPCSTRFCGPSSAAVLPQRQSPFAGRRDASNWTAMALRVDERAARASKFRGGNMGVQAVIQIDSCGSGGLSETRQVSVSVGLT